MLLKSKLEVIEEIAAYYSEDVSRRGLGEEELCEYYTKDGKTCAVGYCLKSPKKYYGNGGSIEVLWGKTIKLEDLKKSYRIDDVDFWQHLQNFHDRSINWDSVGLTIIGKKNLANLKATYAETPVT